MTTCYAHCWAAGRPGDGDRILTFLSPTDRAEYAEAFYKGKANFAEIDEAEKRSLIRLSASPPLMVLVLKHPTSGQFEEHV